MVIVEYGYEEGMAEGTERQWSERSLSGTIQWRYHLSFDQRLEKREDYISE